MSIRKTVAYPYSGIALSNKKCGTIDMLFIRNSRNWIVSSFVRPAEGFLNVKCSKRKDFNSSVFKAQWSTKWFPVEDFILLF